MLLISCVNTRCFFQFGFRHRSFSDWQRAKLTKSNKTTTTKEREQRNSVREDTNTCVSVPLESTPSYTRAHPHIHTHTLLWRKVLCSFTHHHRYPVEVLQRAFTTHKVAKSSPFCVTAGNNTYTCLADSFCRSPLCIRMKREGRGEAGYGGVWGVFLCWFCTLSRGSVGKDGGAHLKRSQKEA